MPISIEADSTLAQGYIKVNGTTAATVTSTGLTTASLQDAAVTPAKLSQPYTLATSQASTSGTSIDFTGIPSWVKRITVMFRGVSTIGTSVPIVQVGSTTITTTGYTAMAWGSSPAGVGHSDFTTGFPTADGGESATYVRDGAATLTLMGSNTWIYQSLVRRGTSIIAAGTGSIALSGALDRIRITTVNGTDTFDAGTINIAYEG